MIDRKKVIENLEECLSASCRGFRPRESCPYNDDEWDIMRDALALLKEQEAKAGKWIEKTDYMGDTYYDCSVCGESWTTIDGTPWQNGMNYCPHCGAKMET
jgi:DNA-directed RNA polymerase subunit RPC12/RpoP